MSSLKAVIEKVRERIEAADYTIETRGAVDTDRPMPQVHIRIEDPGDSTMRQRPFHKKQVKLGCYLYFIFDEDWMVEGIDHMQALQEAIYTGPVPDTDDRLDGIAMLVQHESNDIQCVKDTDRLAYAKVTTTITYEES